MRPDPAQQRELEELYDRYGQLLDDGPLADWPALFTEECMYQILPRDNFDQGLPLAIMRCESRGMLRDRVRSVRETIMHEPRYLRHQITNVSAAKRESAARREVATKRESAPPRDAAEWDVIANYLVVEVLTDELPKILSVGRYLDVVTRDVDGVLRFREKRVVYDSVLVPNTIVYPL